MEIIKGVEMGLDIVTMRPSALFGAYDKDTWSQMFLEVERGIPFRVAPPGGGSVCHAKPVATAFVNAYHKGTKGANYILGGPDVTWFQVVSEIATILNRPQPKRTLPAFIFKLFGWVEYHISRLRRRRPMLTPHTADILCEFVYSDSSLAINTLDYKPSTLNEMLQDCYQWMLDTGRITK